MPPIFRLKQDWMNSFIAAQGAQRCLSDLDLADWRHPQHETPLCVVGSSAPPQLVNSASSVSYHGGVRALVQKHDRYGSDTVLIFYGIVQDPEGLSRFCVERSREDVGLETLLTMQNLPLLR